MVLPRVDYHALSVAAASLKKTSFNCPPTLPEGRLARCWRLTGLATASATVCFAGGLAEKPCRTALKAHSHAVTLGSVDYVDGKLLLLRPRDGPPHALLVVGIDAGVEARSGDRDITHPVVDQLGAAARVDIDQNAVHGRALGSVGSRGVAQVNFAGLGERRR